MRVTENTIGRWARRHRVALVLATFFAVSIAVMPSAPAPLPQGSNEHGSFAGATPSSDDASFTPAGTPTTAVGAIDGSGTPTARGATTATNLSRATQQACRVLPEAPPSVYFPACIPVWSGDNGGATAPGVTANRIRIVQYWYADQLEPTGADYRKVRDTFVGRFNELYSLYGRRLEIVDFYAQNGTDHQGACTDVARMETQFHPFAVMESPPEFARCSAEKGIVNFASSHEHPESFYAKYHPYIWGLEMDCERTGFQIGEYLGKRVAHRPARWAGEPSLRTQERRLALYVPEDDVYGPCIRIAERTLKDEYREEFESVFRYGPSQERLADQATRAILQFKADRVTSIVLAADNLSIRLLTRAATANDFHPEWITTGVAGTTWDVSGRDLDQEQVDGHMFGRAINGEQRLIWGPEGEPSKFYRRVTGSSLPGGTAGYFYGWLDVFNRLQAAGPRLNAEAIAAGSFGSAAIGSETSPVGILSNQARPDGRVGNDHTRGDAAREVYWDGQRVSYDGVKGTFVSTLGGRFFTQGAVPVGEPAVYPDR